MAFSPELAARQLEVGAVLEKFGFAVATADAASEVLALCGRTHVDAVVFDLALTESLGVMTWLDKLKIISPSTSVLAVGHHERLELLRSIVQKVDGDYALFPLSLLELKSRLRRLVDARVRVAPEAPGREGELGDLVGKSAAMQAVRDRIRKVAALASTVLITGESGVGKELIARGIHRLSPRRDNPFIALNCSALTDSLLESELFGHEKGAFTGAAGATKGKFELAHTGTLFLDEIGDMNPSTQAKILRVLEEREFMRVGGSRSIRVDVRVLAATNAVLPKLMAEGKFREDLFYRLKVISIEVVPLRSRSEDIPELARALIDRFARANGVPPKRITDDALSFLQRHRWPGNVRELRNTLESLFVLAPHDVIDVEDLADSFRLSDAPGGPDESLRPPVDEPGPGGSMEQMEAVLIRRTLEECGGNRTKTAARLRIGVRTLQRKIKRYDLD